MIKFKTTKSEVLGDGAQVYAVSYCWLQSLLSDTQPLAYTARREGWACDVYKLGNFYLTTGYAPFGEKLPYDFIRDFEKKADALYSKQYAGDFNTRYNKRIKARERLLNQFIKAVEAGEWEG